MPKILTFKEWKDANPDIVQQTEDKELVDDLECFMCNGKGRVQHDCDCEHCEIMYDECPACDGHGTETAEEYLRTLYNAQVSEDKRRLENWQRMVAA